MISPSSIPIVLPLKIDGFRHGESTANAGQTTQNPDSIPLTEKGHRQAEAIAKTFSAAPSTIIASPFLRAQQTAAPTAARFDRPVHLWPIQEFTYLAPGRCAGTSADQRHDWVKEYWAACEPDAIDGEGAESFSAFIERVKKTINRLEQMEQQDAATIALFGHGQFFQALRWLIQKQPPTIGAAAMRDFRRFDLNHPIPNGGRLTFAFNPPVWTAL